jgi:two-component SAPR family response regulator
MSLALFCLYGVKKKMPASGPIIIVEDDMDDQEILREVFEELKIPNILRFFDSCKKVFDYLVTTIERPFLIISDINLPAVTGIELKQQINGNDCLRKKSIPFIFLSTTREDSVISKAYEVLVQGYFVKPTKLDDLRVLIRMIFEYWRTAARVSI